MQLMFTCSRCGKCCEMTEMELSEEDVERLERRGHPREGFSKVGADGVPRLRNAGKWCCFYDSAETLCRVYGSRPLGCRLYPIVYSIDGRAAVDPLCPTARTISQDEVRAKEIELIELVETLENEAAARRAHPPKPGKKD